MRLIQHNSVLTFKLQIEFVTFKIVPLGGYTPPETLFPHFVATLVVANRNRFQLVGYSFFDVFHRPKMASFKVKLGTKRSRTDSDQGSMGAVEQQECPFQPKIRSQSSPCDKGRCRDGASNCQQCLVAHEQLFFLMCKCFIHRIVLHSGKYGNHIFPV